MLLAGSILALLFIVGWVVYRVRAMRPAPEPASMEGAGSHLRGGS